MLYNVDDKRPYSLDFKTACEYLCCYNPGTSLTILPFVSCNVGILHYIAYFQAICVSCHLPVNGGFSERVKVFKKGMQIKTAYYTVLYNNIY